MNKFFSLNVISLFASGALLSGCASAVIEGAQAAKSEVIIAENIGKANAGDPIAQFKVGEAYCCSLNEGSGIYNTKTSVDWLCRSARQGYSPAMFKLGKIYSGDTVDGVRLARRLAAGVTGSSTNLAVASAWFQMAADKGMKEAADRVRDVSKDMNAAQIQTARQVYGMRETQAPCLWSAVIDTAS